MWVRETKKSIANYNNASLTTKIDRHTITRVTYSHTLHIKLDKSKIIQHLGFILWPDDYPLLVTDVL